MNGIFFAVLLEVSVDTPIKSKDNMYVLTYFTDVSLIKIIFYAWIFQFLRLTYCIVDSWERMSTFNPCHP